MLRNFISGLALVLIVAVTTQQAHAAVAGLISPSILGGLNQTVSTGGSTGFTAGARLGFGLAILEADVSAMYLSRSFSVSGVSGNLNYIQIPLMLRFSLIPMLSVGAGGYYDIALTSGISENYGVRGAIQLSPIGLPLYGEVNYSYNLGSGDSGSLNDLQLLVGFKF